MDDSDELISHGHVGLGMYYCLKNTKRHFEDGKILYDCKKFQSAIPIFIICIEEAFKTIEFATKFRKFESMSKIDWKNLQDHNHKLNYMNDQSIEILDKMPNDDREKLKKTVINDQIDFDRLIDEFKFEKIIIANLQRLKERCLYQNWVKKENNWDDFTDLKLEHKEDLAYYIMEQAHMYLSKMHYSIEHAINIIRRNDIVLDDAPYPTYTEYRQVEDYETKIYNIVIDEQSKYHRGRNIMLGFIKFKIINAVDIINTDKIIKKLRKIMKENNNCQYLHPLINAVFIGMTITKNKPDGNYVGVADDADQTYSGKPRMVATAVIKKENKQLTIEEITINGNKHYTTDKIIEDIFETEIIIEKYPGKEILMENMHQAFAKIGFKIHKATTDEIESALSKCKKMIKTGEIESALFGFKNTIKSEERKDIITKIDNAKKENWENLDAKIRSSIYAIGGPNNFDSKTIPMSLRVESLRKFKVRNIIYGVFSR